MTIRSVTIRFSPTLGVFAAGIVYYFLGAHDFTGWAALIGLFAASLVSSLLPRGLFGAYDLAGRAAVTGVVAAAAFASVWALK